MNLSRYLDEKGDLVENILRDLLHPEPVLANHYRALEYSLLAGGKRIRPILCIAAIEALGGDPGPHLTVAAALECIHTYSLIHDDLPAMDDDDLRRGKPTNHKVFGEAEAILAGDGLLTLAFELLSRPGPEAGVPADVRLRIVHLVAQAAGSAGMVGGQSLDIAAEGKDIPLPTLRTIHRKKTGALITAAIQTGALLAGATTDQYHALTAYGKCIGLTFQMTDDLLNVTGTAAELGKAAGSDAARGKATYPALLGLEETVHQVAQTTQQALDALVEFGPGADPLRQLARYIMERKK